MFKETIMKLLNIGDRTLGYTDTRMYNPGYIGWQDVSQYYTSNKYDNVFPYIDLIASKFAAQDVYMVDKNGDKTAGDESTGSANLFSRIYYPNDRMSDYDLREAMAILSLFEPKAMWRVHGKTTVRGGRKYILPKDITGFTPLIGVITDVVNGEVIYKLPNNEELEYHQIIIDEDFNPEGFGLGYSPTKAAETWIDLDDFMACHQKGYFKNGAVASGMYNIIAKSPQDFQDIKHGIMSSHQGVGKNNNVMFNYTPVGQDGKTGTGQIEWIPFNVQNKDLALKDLFEQVDKRIKQKFRIPPSMVGDSENNNLSSAQVDRKNFALDVMQPFTIKRWSRWNMSLNRITGGFGGELRADVNVPAISEEEKFTAETKQIDANTVTSLTFQGFTAESAIEYVKTGDISVLIEKPKEVVAPAVPNIEDIKDTPEMPVSVQDQTSKMISKSISARDYPDLYDGTDINPDDLGCIMIDTESLEIKSLLDDDMQAQLFDEPKYDQSSTPAENVPHITLLYGLLENGNIWKDKVDQVLEDWSIKTVTIEKVDYFKTPDSYAVIGHIEKTPELLDGHERLTLLPHIQTFSEYKPHITLAYVSLDGDVEKFVKVLGDKYNGTKLKTTKINYGDKPKTESKQLKKEITPSDREKYEQRLALAVRGRMEAQIDKAMELVKSKAISEDNPVDKDEDELLTADMLAVLLAFMNYQGDIEQAANIRVMFNAGLDASGVGDFALTGKQLADYRKYVSEIATGYNAQTAEKIRNTLITAREQGLSRDEIKNQLRGLIEDWRIDRLTRTETQLAGGRSSVYSMINIAKEMGVKVYKVWETTSGAPCEFCKSMEGTRIDVTANYLNYGDIIHGVDGGQMKNTWTNISSAQAHANCQCREYFEVEQ